MRRRLSALVVAAVVAASLTCVRPARADAGSAEVSAAATARPEATEGRASALATARARALMPQGLSFEANHGQADPAVRFLARGPGYSLFLTAEDAVFVFRTSLPTRAGRSSRAHVEAPAKPTVIRMRLVGANPSPEVVGLDQLPGKVNHFAGSDPRNWRTDVPRFGRVQYTEVYPGVDLVYYAGKRGELEYDFVVAPGADPGCINLAIDGGAAAAFDARGDFVVRTESGEVRVRRPLVYQDLPGGERRVVASRYVLTDAADGSAGRRLAFQIAPYDVARPLVIDPVLEYSTYLGGAHGAGALAEAVAVDSAGSVYVAGWTYSDDFPVRQAYQDQLLGPPNEFGDMANAFVTKIDAGGTLIYSTYLGPTETFAQGIAVDQFGNAYVAGQTYSPDFPTTQGAYRTECGAGAVPSCSRFHGDIFVTKLSRSGSALVYSTFVGAGTSGDIPGPAMGIAVDAEGHAHVVGYDASPDFATKNAFQPTPGDELGQDVFVVKLNNVGSDAVYATFLGGSGYEFRTRVAVDRAGNAYVTGSTGSDDFPTKNSIQPFNQGDGFAFDAFVTKLAPNGSLVYSTYVGGTGDDLAYDIAVDSAGGAYIVGQTQSPDFPVRNPIQVPIGVESFLATSLLFASKLSPDGSELVYSTYFGTTNLTGGCFGFCDERAYGVGVDAEGNAYITGLTRIPDFPVTSNAFQPRTANIQDEFGNNSTSDVFLVQLDSSGTVLRYSTFLGGSREDWATDLAVDGGGGVSVVGSTDSADFPTRHAIQPDLPGGPDPIGQAFVTRFSFSAEERAPAEFVTFPAGLPSLPPTAVVGRPYVGNVGIGAGQPPYEIRLVRGALPAGLRLGLQGSGTGGSSAVRRSVTGAGGSVTTLGPGDVGGPIVDGTPTDEGESCFVVSVRGAGDLVGVEKPFRITTLGNGPGVAVTPTLQVKRGGSGAGRVGILDKGAVAAVYCDGDCVRPYAVCDEVQLIAEAASGSIFAGWSGGNCGSNGDCRVLMNQDVVVTGRFDRAGEPLALVAAILPTSRSVRVGTAATVSATMIATGEGLAVGCTVGLDGSVPVTLTYQPYDAGTGLATGPANQPVSLTPGVPQALLLTVTPTAAFQATEVVPRFACANSAPAPLLSGVNTLWLSATTDTPADVVILASTPSHDGIARVSGVPGAAAFALATVNIGAGDDLTLTADTGGVSLPVGLLVCETGATGHCLSAPGQSARRRIEAGETPTYTVLVTATGPIAADASRHRVYLRFHDAAGAMRGAASVAVQTEDVAVAASRH